MKISELHVEEHVNWACNPLWLQLWRAMRPVQYHPLQKLTIHMYASVDGLVSRDYPEQAHMIQSPERLDIHDL